MPNYLESFANALTLELSGAVNSSVTTLPVTTSTGFPQSGRYRIKVDDELMIARYSDSTNLTVERGAEGTTADAHSSGASVYLIATAEGCDQAINGSGGFSDATCEYKPFRFCGTATEATTVTCYLGGADDGPVGGANYDTGYFQLEPYDIVWFEGTFVVSSTLGDWRAGRIAWCARHDGAAVSYHSAGGSMTFNEAFSDSNAAVGAGTGLTISGNGFVPVLAFNNVSGRDWRVVITGHYTKLNLEVASGSSSSA